MEIKLRAWDKCGQRMLIAYEPDEQGKREYKPFEFGVGFSGFDKNDLELMLFTGMIDNSGNEIYENDIVLDDGTVGIVQWDENTFSWYIDEANKFEGLREFTRNGLDIIGNIYENPELLRIRT